MKLSFFFSRYSCQNLKPHHIWTQAPRFQNNRGVSPCWNLNFNISSKTAGNLLKLVKNLDYNVFCMTMQEIMLKTLLQFSGISQVGCRFQILAKYCLKQPDLGKTPNFWSPQNFPGSHTMISAKQTIRLVFIPKTMNIYSGVLKLLA